MRDPNKINKWNKNNKKPVIHAKILFYAKLVTLTCWMWYCFAHGYPFTANPVVIVTMTSQTKYLQQQCKHHHATLDIINIFVKERKNMPLFISFIKKHARMHERTNARPHARTFTRSRTKYDWEKKEEKKRER